VLDDGSVALLLGNPLGNSNGFEDGGGLYIRTDVVVDISTIGDDAGVIAAEHDGERVGLAVVMGPLLAPSRDVAFSAECGEFRCVHLFKGHW
jgi:hypothetical protein